LKAVLEAIPRSSDGFVFHGPLGGRLKADTVRRIFVNEVLTRLAEKFPTPSGEIGFVNGRLHSFRHFFCSLCVSRGVSQQVVMLWLGHRESSMVEHYFHLYSDEAHRQMRRVKPSDDPKGE